MTGQMIDIEAKEGGKFTSYLAKSTSGNGPGIVMIQEIFVGIALIPHTKKHLRFAD